MELLNKDILIYIYDFLDYASLTRLFMANPRLFDVDYYRKRKHSIENILFKNYYIIDFKYSGIDIAKYVYGENIKDISYKSDIIIEINYYLFLEKYHFYIQNNKLKIDDINKLNNHNFFDEHVILNRRNYFYKKYRPKKLVSLVYSCIKKIN